MTKELFEEITEWQDSVFTKATGLSAAHHLEEECGELIKALSEETEREEPSFDGEEKVLHEYADCFLLLFGSAHRYGLNYDQILRAIQMKMIINRARKWGSVNDKGYVKHVE